MQCQDVMNMAVKTCRIDARVFECGEIMSAMNVDCVPIVDDYGRLMGVLTDRDLALRIVGENRSCDTRVYAVMNKELVTCLPDDSVQAAEERMLVYRRSRVLVVDRDRHLMGVVGLSELARVESTERMKELLRTLEPEEAPRSVPPPGAL